MFGLAPLSRYPLHTRNQELTNFHNFIDEFFNDSSSLIRNIGDSFRMDVREDEDAYHVDAELPGVSKEEIKLNLSDGYLTIVVERSAQSDEDKGTYLHRERKYSSMQRSIYLQNTSAKDVTAKFDNGVLEITVPKEKHAELVTRIDIQ